MSRAEYRHQNAICLKGWTLMLMFWFSGCGSPASLGVATEQPASPPSALPPPTIPAPEPAKRAETPSKPDFIFGALDQRTDLTFEQRKSIRVANAILLREKARWAMEQKQPLQLPAGRLEIELLRDPLIVIGGGHKLILAGESDESTVVMCYPLVRPHREEVFIDHLPGAHLNIENITVARPDSNRWETYAAQWTAAGDSTYTMALTDANLRPGWHNHLVGQTLYYTYNDKKVGGKLTIVQVQPDARTLTVKGKIPAEEPVPGQQRVAWDFPAAIEPHLYRQYGALWYEQGTSSTAIKHLEGHPLKQPGTLDISHFTTRNFSIGLMRSGGQFDLNIQQSRIHGQEIALNFFVGNELNTSVFYIDSLVVHHSGFKSMGDISPNISADKIWGSGGYLHPNVTVKANRLYCLDNTAGAWRQYSGSGKKPYPEGRICEYRNSTFARNGEYNLFLSSSMPSIVIDCKFLSGSNKMGLDSKYLNCSFINELVHGYPISEPIGNSGSIINFTDCDFKNSNLAIQWKEYGELATIQFNSCTFNYQKGGRFFGAFIEVSVELMGLEFVNCKLELDPFSATLPKLVYLDRIKNVSIEDITSKNSIESLFGCRGDCVQTNILLSNNSFQFKNGLHPLK